MKEVDKPDTLTVLLLSGGVSVLAGVTLVQSGDIENGSMAILLGGIGMGYSFGKFMEVVA